MASLEHMLHSLNFNISYQFHIKSIELHNVDNVILDFLYLTVLKLEFPLCTLCGCVFCFSHIFSLAVRSMPHHNKV